MASRIYQLQKKFNFCIFLIAILPVCLLLPSGVINLVIILISVLFLIEILLKKKIIFFHNYFFYLLIIFFFSLIFNILFNSGETLSFERQLGFFRFILFVFAIKYYLTFKRGIYFNLIIKSWVLVFFIVSFDILFEFIFGFDLIGNTSAMQGRIASFLGEELKIANYYNGFIFIAFSFILAKCRNEKFIIFLFLLFVIIAFLTGERSNYIKIFIGSLLYILLLKEINLKTKFTSIIFLSLAIFSIIALSQDVKMRINQLVKPIYEMGFTKSILTSHYGAHYHTAYMIYKKNKIFGIGLKNFRSESAKIEYKENKNNIYKRDNWATHPHQVHLEFLSETGIFGYTFFLLFIIFSLVQSIKNYYYSNNRYLLGSIIFFITSVLPILPTGSFFTTYTATIFWINYALMISITKNNKNE